VIICLQLFIIYCAVTRAAYNKQVKHMTQKLTCIIIVSVIRAYLECAQLYAYLCTQPQ